MNLLEYARGQDPFAATRIETEVALLGGGIGLTYRRSKAAVADGLSFEVTWSDMPSAGNWNKQGVIQSVVAEDGASETVNAFVPRGSAGRRFVRLEVIR